MIDPLKTIPGNPRLKVALAAYQAAPPALQKAWTDAYTAALPKARLVRGVMILPPGHYGPVAPMMAALLGLAQSGGLDGGLLAGNHRFYETDYTKPLLFLSGGSHFEDRAYGQHLLGEQWGMMNETGSYPGQVWLWLYTFWYQVEPFKSLRKRRRADLRPDGPAQPRLRLHPVHPGAEGAAAPPARLPRDLARPLPRHRRLSGGAREPADQQDQGRDGRDGDQQQEPGLSSIGPGAKGVGDAQRPEEGGEAVHGPPA